MAWCRPGDNPLSEPMMVSLLTHVCITRPQWAKVAPVLVMKTCTKRAKLTDTKTTTKYKPFVINLNDWVSQYLACIRVKGVPANYKSCKKATPIWLSNRSLLCFKPGFRNNHFKAVCNYLIIGLVSLVWHLSAQNRHRQTELMTNQCSNTEFSNSWRLVCQKQVSRRGESNFIPHMLWYVITCPQLNPSAPTTIKFRTLLRVSWQLILHIFVLVMLQHYLQIQDSDEARAVSGWTCSSALPPPRTCPGVPIGDGVYSSAATTTRIWGYAACQVNRLLAQIPQCTSSIFHNAPFCSRNVHMRAHFCCKMVRCEIFVLCIVGIRRMVYTLLDKSL